MSDNPTADIDNICFFDTETRAEDDVSAEEGDVRDAGTYRYAESAFVIILTYAIARQPVKLITLPRFDGDWLCWADMPDDLRRFYERAEAGGAWFAALNAGFDRAVWNRGTYDFPTMRPDMILDVMAQATASNLPPSLEGAARFVTGTGKQEDGKALIKMFCRADGFTPQEKPEEWQRFCSYGVRDTAQLREVWDGTRPLSLQEWQDYWVDERINERGMGLDVPFIERCNAMANAEIARLNRELSRWTNGRITAVTQAQRIARWIFDRLVDHPEGAELLVKEWNEEAEVDLDNPKADVAVGKLSIAKDRLNALLAYFAAVDEKRGLTEAEQLTVDVITARQFGGGSAFSKFQKMLDQRVGNRLKGQFVFNGAPQTGRYSSKGVQLHNLIRASLGKFEEEAIEFINELEVQ